MRRTGLWWAAALVVASNLGAWGVAALNRSGEPEAVLELTERELRLPAKEADSTALTLTLEFEWMRAAGPRRPPRDAAWFDRAKLESVGFECSRPVSPEHASFYRSQPPRSAYAALEYEGDAWRRQMQEPAAEPLEQPAGGGAPRAEARPERAEDRSRQPRLVAIDVGHDPVALRQRYPDRTRVAIVEATVALQYVSNEGQPPFLAGRVTSVLPGEINVPRQWRPLLAGLQTEEQVAAWPPPLHDPRYRVTVKWGRNFEPWIASVQLLPPAPPR